MSKDSLSSSQLLPCNIHNSLFADSALICVCVNYTMQVCVQFSQYVPTGIGLVCIYLGLPPPQQSINGGLLQSHLQKLPIHTYTYTLGIGGK